MDIPPGKRSIDIPIDDFLPVHRSWLHWWKNARPSMTDNLPPDAMAFREQRYRDQIHAIIEPHFPASYLSQAQVYLPGYCGWGPVAYSEIILFRTIFGFSTDVLGYSHDSGLLEEGDTHIGFLINSALPVPTPPTPTIAETAAPAAETPPASVSTTTANPPPCAPPVCDDALPQLARELSRLAAWNSSPHSLCPPLQRRATRSQTRSAMAPAISTLPDDDPHS